MNQKEILDRLWEAYRETPVASFVLQRKLNLRHDELSRVLNLLGDLADSGAIQNGYRIKRVASTVYKLIKAKGKPLPNENGGLTGQSERDFPQ